MAVTTEGALGVQFYEGTASGVRYLDPRHAGRVGVMVASFAFTQGAAAGDVNSIQRWLVLPAGQVKVLGLYLANSAFGASRTLNVGYEAYTTRSGTAVAAAATAFYSALDVAAQGARMAWFDAPFDARGGVIVRSVVAGGTIPAAATLSGYFLLAS